MLVLDRAPDLAARIRLQVLDRAAVVHACRDATAAGSRLAGGTWDVLVAGPSLMHRGGLRRLGSLHQRFPGVSVVMALSERPQADLAEIVQVGADDLVPLDIEDRELAKTLDRAVRIARGRRSAVAPPQRGRIVTITSASGGCGKTFVATNAAGFLARRTGQPVVLLDLDLQFGEVTTALRLRPDLTITDALAADAEGHDLEEHLDEFLLAHPDGFSVLAAPRHPAEADSVTPADIVRVLEALRARGVWVVVDTSEGLNEIAVAALDATDHVLMLATPDRPSLVNLITLLRTVEGRGIAGHNISVVLNKAESDVGLDEADMAAELGRRFDAVLPYAREVSRSVNLGVPLLVGEPKSPVSRALSSALGAALPQRVRPPLEPAVARSPRHLWARSAKPRPETILAPVPDAAAPPLPLPTVADPRPNGPAPDQLPLPLVANRGPVQPVADQLPDPAPTPRPWPARSVCLTRPLAAEPRPDRTRPRSCRPARSGPSRPSTPPLAAPAPRDRGPPDAPPSRRRRVPGGGQRAGKASRADAVPARWRVRRSSLHDCTTLAPALVRESRVNDSSELSRMARLRPTNPSKASRRARVARTVHAAAPAACSTESPWRCAGPLRCCSSVSPSS